MDNQDDPKPSRKRKPGPQEAIPNPKCMGTLKRPERPRLVVYVEPSIFHEMHELAFKNDRSVSNLAQLAMARLLADFEAGRLEINPEYSNRKPVGRA